MAEIETLEACPSCKCASNELFINSNGYSIVRCKECGLLYVNPRPSERSIKQLFMDEYIGSAERVEEDFTSWRQLSLKREAARIVKLLPQGGKLLDLGTASGAFLGEFSGKPEWVVEGVEPSRFAAKAAAEKYKVKVSEGFLRDIGLPEAAYDVVVSLDAFYFHPDPKSDLAEISRILKQGGIFAVEIPGLRFRLMKNTGALCRLIYGVPAKLNAGVHLFYYSRESLGQLVNQFGFEEIAAYPEQSPSYGAWYGRLVSWMYSVCSGLLYKLSAGKVNLAPKEFLVYRKVSQ